MKWSSWSASKPEYEVASGCEKHTRCHCIFWGRVVSVLASVCDSPAGSPASPRGAAVSYVTKKKKEKKKISPALFLF